MTHDWNGKKVTCLNNKEKSTYTFHYQFLPLDHSPQLGYSRIQHSRLKGRALMTIFSDPQLMPETQPKDIHDYLTDLAKQPAIPYLNQEHHQPDAATLPNRRPL